MSRERHIDSLEKSVGIATLALRAIAEHEDCDYVLDRDDERPRPCPCPKCTAVRALETIDGGWRFVGARADRVKTSPRERKMVEAWRQEASDRLLGMILSDDTPRGSPVREPNWEQPTPRDWFVATSVVQWLATNVGMEVLRKAGFEYKQFDQDRKEREQAEDKASTEGR